MHFRLESSISGQSTIGDAASCEHAKRCQRDRTPVGLQSSRATALSLKLGGRAIVTVVPVMSDCRVYKQIDFGAAWFLIKTI